MNLKDHSWEAVQEDLEMRHQDKDDYDYESDYMADLRLFLVCADIITGNNIVTQEVMDDYVQELHKSLRNVLKVRYGGEVRGFTFDLGELPF